MKIAFAFLAVLLLAPCACKRHDPAAVLPVAYAEPIDVGPAVEPASPPTPTPAPAVDPEPTPEEIAAFNAPVPK